MCVYIYIYIYIYIWARPQRRVPVQLRDHELPERRLDIDVNIAIDSKHNNEIAIINIDIINDIEYNSYGYRY